jgi:hypothetical protein
MYEYIPHTYIRIEFTEAIHVLQHMTFNLHAPHYVMHRFELLLISSFV